MVAQFSVALALLDHSNTVELRFDRLVGRQKNEPDPGGG
jgi:hypothetical protein